MPRALIIDDSRATCTRLGQLLEKAGWEVSSETSAELGAAAALSSPPDVVLSDLWMPGMSGLLLCRLLHEDPTTAHVPIVLMSAKLDRRSRFWAKHSGAALTLNKEQIDGLPEVLTGALNPRGGQIRAPTTEVTAASIPSRLSWLLDQALFDSVIARELTRLAIQAEVAPFFDELVELMGQVVTYRWLALKAVSEGATVSCAHVHPSDQPQALTEIAETLGEVDEKGTVLCDDRAQHDASFPVSHNDLERSLWNLDVGASASASLTICIDRRECSAADRLVFEVVHRELAAPLRALLLSQRAQQLARTDMLTTLWNRRQGLEFLEQAFAAYKRYGHVLSVAMVDIDHFKRINDTYGHQCGDQALRHVAHVIRKTCRKADAVARWGGEEFLLILPSTGSAGARVAAERLRMSLNGRPVRFDSGSECFITVSAGVAQCDDEGYEAALNRADKALYLAKSRGRNRVELG